LNLRNGNSNPLEIDLNFSGGSTSATPVAGNTTTTAPEIVLNLGSTSNEQITINLSESTNGAEQVGISVKPSGGSGNSNNQEQVTLNLNNTTDHIVLNVLNAITNQASTQIQTNGLSVVA
jgi:hypothetical protein